MYILKNSLLCIGRNKGRNILIAIILIVIATTSSIALAIRNSSLKIVESYESKYKVEASIGMNREKLVNSFKESGDNQEKMIESFNEIDSISIDEINNYGNSKYVTDYYYVYNINMDATDLTEATDSLVKETTETKTETKRYEPKEGPQGRPFEGGFSESRKTTTTKIEKIYNDKALNGAFNIVGYSSSDSMTDFIEGKYKIVEGVVNYDFSSSSCVISEELATLNSLSVGDTITLVNPNNSKKTYNLEISGIYKEESDEAADMKTMFTNSANTIITNSNIIEKIKNDDEDLNITITPTFILENKDVVNSFKEEVAEKGLSEYYQVTDNLNTIEEATKSIENVKIFSTSFLIITLIIGVIILFVINMINIRERKYEIGVMRTIGMKKIHVVLQFVCELFLVTFISLLIGTSIGAFTSVDISNNLLQKEIENAKNDNENINENFGRNNDNLMNFEIVNKIEPVENLSAIVDFKVILELLGIGLLLTIISSISACISISRLSPLTILKERT